MLRRLHHLIGYRISTLDDEIGAVGDFYFDDQKWTVRYLVVETGSWLFGRRLLVATDAIESVDRVGELLNVKLTKEQVENSPDLDLTAPFTREQEVALRNYYGWPGYWTTMPLAGMMPLTAGLPVVPPKPGIEQTAGLEQYVAAEGDDAVLPTQQSSASSAVAIDPDLRSLQAVRGYTIEATDGEIGHAADFFAGENDWVIRYMEINTGNWWPGKHVLVGADWITALDWAAHKIRVKVNRQQVQESPEYDPKAALDRAYEGQLHEHYLFPTYWGV